MAHWDSISVWVVELFKLIEDKWVNEGCEAGTIVLIYLGEIMIEPWSAFFAIK